MSGEVAGFWETVRQRGLERLDKREAGIYERAGELAQDTRAATDELRRIKRERDWIRRNPEWQPERPERTMPSLSRIAEHWLTRNVFEIRTLEPHCFACGYMRPVEADSLRKRWNKASRWLQRAHLVGRIWDGLDGPQNIVPLCGQCHRIQPDHDAAEAIAFIRAGGWRTWVYERVELQAL